MSEIRRFEGIARKDSGTKVYDETGRNQQGARFDARRIECLKFEGSMESQGRIQGRRFKLRKKS
jgi:hypothetical protein